MQAQARRRLEAHSKYSQKQTLANKAREVKRDCEYMLQAARNRELLCTRRESRLLICGEY